VQSSVTDQVLHILGQRIVAPEKGIRLDAKTPLLSSGLGLDSVAVLDLIMELEREFDVSFDDADLSVELFQNAESLASAVEAKLRAPRAGA
jgi:acyl carrier protein